MPVSALGSHVRWWQRLDERTRSHLLADRGRDDLPVDLWGMCIASAEAEDLIDRDGWFDDVCRRRLPFAAACFLDVVRYDLQRRAVQQSGALSQRA